MNINEISQIVKKNPGCFRAITFEHVVPLKSEYFGVLTVRKSAVVRFGISYRNMGSIKNNGKTPGKLPWGTWIVGESNYFIQNGCKTYLRCYTANKNQINTKYFYNGKEIDEKTAKSIGLASAFKEQSCVFNVNLENIVFIK